MATDNIPNRNNWHFGNYEKYVLEDKNALIEYHIRMALIKTLNMFEYEGLPETIPARELELIIQICGFAYLLKANDGKFYAFYGGLGGQPNEYYQPTEFIVANPYLKFFDQVKVNEEGVLVWNDLAHYGLYPMLRRYAEFMAECDITLRFGLINARIVSVLEAINDKAKTEAEAFIADIVSGKKLGVIVGKGFEDENGTLRVNEYRRANNQDIKDVMELQQYVKASWLNEIGLQANFNMKREAINESESAMNEEALKPLCDDLLKSRQMGFDLFNKKYGFNVKVKFNSSWVAREKLGEEANKEAEQEETQETQDNEGGNEND